MSSSQAHAQCKKIAKSTKKQCKNSALDGESFCSSHQDAEPSAPKPSTPVARQGPVAPVKAKSRVKVSSRDRAPPSPPKIRVQKKKAAPVVVVDQNHYDEDEDEDDVPPVAPLPLPVVPAVPSVPLCHAISKTSKTRCKNKISLAGERNCPVHGGKTKNGSKMRKRRMPVPWALMNSACIGYLLNNHGHCKCLLKPNANKCKTVQVILWFQSLASHVSSRSKASARATYPTPSVLSKWLEQSPANMSNELILEKARALLGVDHVAWLQAMIPIKGRSVDVDEEDDDDDSEEKNGDSDEHQHELDEHQDESDEEVHQHESDEEEKEYYVAPKGKPKKKELARKPVKKTTKATSSKGKEDVEDEDEEVNGAKSNRKPEKKVLAREPATVGKKTSKATSSKGKKDEDEVDDVKDVEEDENDAAMNISEGNGDQLEDDIDDDDDEDYELPVTKTPKRAKTARTEDVDDPIVSFENGSKKQAVTASIGATVVGSPSQMSSPAI